MENMAEASEQDAETPREEDFFFPGPDDFADHLGVPIEKFRGPRKVLVSLDVLRTLIGLAAAGWAFDRDFYLERNPDLRQAATAGRLADPRAHFVNEGYFERRPASRKLASPVDESWYLREYADVSDGIKAGTVDSATQHYVTTGRKEGRLPAGDVPEEIRRLIALLHEPA